MEASDVEWGRGTARGEIVHRRRSWLAARGAVSAEDGDVVRVGVPSALVIDGERVAAAQLVSDGGPRGAAAPERQVLALGQKVVDGLRGRGARAVYAVPSEEWPTPVLEGLGFAPTIGLSRRNFYLSLGALSGVLEDRGPHPLRKAAAFARRIRQKMIEVSFDPGWLSDAARVSEEREAALGLAVARDADYLAWRYQHAAARGYRLLVLRNRAGQGIDGYAVVEPIASEMAKVSMRVVDHWSRSADRVGDSRFMFELALWFLSERVSMVQALGVQGSALDGLFLRTGGFKKAWVGQLWWRALDDRTAVPSAASAALRASDFLDD